MRLRLDERPGALVINACDCGAATKRAFHRKWPVQLDRLLGMHQHRPIEITKVPRHPRLRKEYAVGWQDLLLHTGCVLGGELQLLQRITKAGTYPDRVEQRIFRSPRALLRLSGFADEAVIERHGDLQQADGRPHLRWPSPASPVGLVEHGSTGSVSCVRCRAVVARSCHRHSGWPDDSLAYFVSGLQDLGAGRFADVGRIRMHERLMQLWVKPITDLAVRGQPEADRDSFQ